MPSEDHYQLLVNLALAIQASLDLRKVFWRAAEQLHQLLGCEHVTLILAEGDFDKLEGFAVELKPAIRWTNLSKGDEARLRSRLRDPGLRVGPTTDRPLQQAGFHWEACVPLHCRGKLIGLLRLAARQEKPAWDTEFLQELAAILAAAVDHALAYAQIQRLKRQLERANVYLRHELQTERYPEIVGALPGVRKRLSRWRRRIARC